MARSKRKKTATVENQGFKYLDVSSRKIVVWNADLTTTKKTKGVAVYDVKKMKLDDAIVKPTIRYAEGDEARAAEVEKEMLAYARKFAKHVYSVERIVVKSEKTRMPELVADVDPMDAVKLWMEKRPPLGGIPKNAVTVLISTYLKEVPKSKFERQMPEPVAVRSIFGESYGPFPETFCIDNISDGVHAVTARYKSSKGRSNRAGKSALMSAMELARYGTIGSVKQGIDKYIHSGKKFMIAGVGLENADGVVQKISRRIGKSGAKLMVDDNLTKQSDAHELFGRLTLDDFLRTQFVRAGDLHGLLAEGSTKIKTDMMRWHGLEGWGDVNKLITKDAGEIKTKLLHIEARTNSVAEYHEEAEIGIEQMQQQIKEAESEIEIMEASAGSVAERKLKYDELNKKLSKSVAISECLEVVKNSKQVKKKHKQLQDQLEKVESNLDEVNGRLSVLRGSLETSEKHLIKFSGNCPVDDAACPRVTEIVENANAIKNKCAKFQINIDKENKTRKGLNDKRHELQELVDDALDAVREVNIADEYLEEHGRTFDDIKKLENQVKKLDADETDDAFDLQDARNDLIDLKVTLKQYIERQEQIERDSKTHRQLLKELSMLQYAAFITGKTGIPAMQIENASQSIEGMANDVLEKMGMEYRLEFAFEEEVKTRLAGSCRNCGHVFDSDERKCPSCDEKRGNAFNDVFKPMVREGKYLQTFSQDSDGGKAILALAVRVALARHLGIVSLFLDEVDGHLDDANLEAFIRLVHRLITDGYFKQVFVISHKHRIAEAIASNILVLRHDRWSEVGWE